MVFGLGEFDRLGELAGEYGVKPLVVVGRKFARESGLLDRALKLLESEGMEPVVFEGIEPNPRLSTCVQGARAAAENDCDMVIGIGGGSVMDASKTIAFGFYDPDGIWRRIAHWLDDYEKPSQALPIILVSTLAATGSEGDNGAVITNWETREKLGVIADCLYPKVSIVDPKLTLSVPLGYTLDGAVDMSVHVLEGYFNSTEIAPFSDRMSEAFFVEVIIAIDRLLQKPEDLLARSQLSYLGAIALTGFINRPRGGAAPLHVMQHPLSAHYDISHGRGLALLLPRWLKYVSREKPDKIIQFGERVFGLDLETHHPFEAADRAIETLVGWLEDVGASFFMDDLGIPNDPETFRKMAEDAVRMYGDEDGLIEGIKPLGVDDIVAVYESCVRTGAPEIEESEAEAEVAEPAAEEEEDESVAGEVSEGEPGGPPVEEAALEVVEEVIEVVEGEPLPEGVEGEDYVIVEEVIEIVEEEEK